jgi:hypothetical protein
VGGFFIVARLLPGFGGISGVSGGLQLSFQVIN